MANAPDEREFRTFVAGQVRDIILVAFRNELRQLVDPTTGSLFTEEQVQLATQPGSRFYVEAEAIDLYAMAVQARASWLSDQVDPRRANTTVLEQLHGELWLGDGPRLAATGASGIVLATADEGVTFVGSTVEGDPNATVGTDPDGRRYQVLANVAADANRNATVSLAALDRGFDTNIAPGTVIKWSENVPLNADPEATVLDQEGRPGVGFTGGFDEESDAELANRVVSTIRDRAGAGNAPHFNAWAQRANAAVEQAFVYPTALHAGSVLVAITQRRNQHALDGPQGRFPAVGTLTAVTSFLTPPASPVVPPRVFVLVTAPQAQSSDLILTAAMAQGYGGGWADVTPWPAPASKDLLAEELAEGRGSAAITTVSPTPPQTSFTLGADPSIFPLPGGASVTSPDGAPKLMVWDDTRSRFERLYVNTITPGGSEFAVTLTSAPQTTLQVGMRISPYTDRHEVIARALEAHFDSLGPGEIVAPSDLRAARATRQPLASSVYPQRTGASAATEVAAALGGVAADVTLAQASRTEVDLPGSISDGPNMLVLGHVNVYPG